MLPSPLPPLIDAQRGRLGFLGLEETMALMSRGITILDPCSTLLSADVILHDGIVLWPGTIVQSLGGSRIAIGSGTVLFPNTRIIGTGGSVTIEEGTEIGEEGGFTIQAGSGDAIHIGDGARLLGGGSLSRSNRIGRGAQILGPVRCQNCRLGDGGTYRDPEPDERGGVLKGSGVARDIDVPRGHVIQAFGLFADAPVRRQIEFHPRPGS
jgi:hypothetical protein